jgi:hypothetical protein
MYYHLSKRREVHTQELRHAPEYLNLHEYHCDKLKTPTDCLCYKVKGEFHPVTGHEGPEGK